LLARVALFEVSEHRVELTTDAVDAEAFRAFRILILYHALEAELQVLAPRLD